jgi:hypothetical protein
VSNANAMSVVQQLLAHPAVKHVYHPSTETTDLYNEFKRARVGGYRDPSRCPSPAPTTSRSDLFSLHVSRLPTHSTILGTR